MAGLRYLDLEFSGGQEFDTSAMEVDMGDQAGLKPLPMGRMFRQAGRPMNSGHRTKPNPELHDLTIKRNQNARDTIDNWNPLQAEDKQRLNNTNPSPRSKPASPSSNTANQFLADLGNKLEHRSTRAFNSSNRNDPGWSKGSAEFKEFMAREKAARDKTDLSEFLSPQEFNSVKSMVFDFLDSKAGNAAKLDKRALPAAMNRFPKLGNDLLYEWNARRQKQLQGNTLDFLEIIRDTVRPIDTPSNPNPLGAGIRGV